MTAFELNKEQKTAATTLSGHVSIAAGAGSGKTRVLAERCANAVVPDRLPGWQAIEVEELLAITFTDKAAGELAERVRRTLRDFGHNELAVKVDSAWISTIHGMCARILRASALEAGVDPAFKVLDTVEQGRLKERAFEAVASEAMSAGDGPRVLFAEYGFEPVASAVQGLSDDLSRAGLTIDDVRQEPYRPARSICADALEFFKGARARLQGCGAPADVASGHASACTLTVERLEALAGSDLPEDELALELWRAVQMHCPPRTWKGVKDIKDDVAARRKDLMQEAATALTHGRCSALLVLTGRYSERVARMKEDAGALDFDDLQKLVADLFVRQPEVAARWAQRFGITMVDEFQDTDDQQLRIVRAIAGDDLCTVGDAMQSIYRFRGADINVYRVHNEAMAASDATSVELSLNYRSHPAILKFVNHVFGRLLEDGLVRLRAGRIEPEHPFIPGDARVEVMASPAKGRKSDPSRTALAQRIASRVAELRAGGVALGDVVVLLRSYRHAEAYASAMRDEGLDAVVVGGNRFMDLPEVGVLRALCRLLANRGDEHALGIVLASPLCGVSDDALASMRAAVEAGHSGDLAGAAATVTLDTADARRRDLLLHALDEADGLLASRPLGEVVLRVFEKTGWDIACLTRRTAGLQTYASVLKFARMADAFESEGGHGPAAFAAYLDEKQRYGDHESPAAVVGEGTDAVRIMSIHASKGLEFPVVIVPELEGSAPAESGIARWAVKPEPRIAMRMPSSAGKDAVTAWFEQLKRRNTEENEAEYLRVFYVAFTRARELLILAGTVSSGEATNMIREVISSLGCEPTQSALLDDEAFGPVRLESIPPVERDEVDEEAEEQVPADSAVIEWLDLVTSSTEPLEDPPLVPSRMSYSGIKAFDTCARRFRAQRIIGMRDRTPSVEPSVSAADFGSAVHAALQAGVVAGDTPRLEAIAKFHRLDDELVARLAATLDAYERSDVAQVVASWGGSVRREAQFAIRIGEPGQAGFILDGSIDLYAREGGRGLVVDYKTGAAGGESELEDRYRLQACCYALACIKDGCREVSVTFVRPEVVDSEGRIQRVEYLFTQEDATRLEAELLGRYELMLSGRFAERDRRDDQACRACPVSSDCPAPS